MKFHPSTCSSIIRSSTRLEDRVVVIPCMFGQWRELPLCVCVCARAHMHVCVNFVCVCMHYSVSNVSVCSAMLSHIVVSLMSQSCSAMLSHIAVLLNLRVVVPCHHIL